MAFDPIQSSYGRLRWPFLGAPRESDTGGDPRYAVTFVAGGPNGLRAGDQEFLTAVMQQMDAACIQKWNVGVDGMRQRMAAANKVFNLALKRNNDPARAKHAGIGEAPAGFHFEAKTKYQPSFFNAAGEKLAHFDPTFFYDGVVARVWVSAYTYEHPKSGPGVGLNIHGVQFVQHAPALGSAPIDAKPADNVPSDLPSAPPPAVTGATPAPTYGTPGAPPAASPEASYYPPATGQTPQPATQPPAAGGPAASGFGF